MKNEYKSKAEIETNHELINSTLKIICDRLNRLGVDYYVNGALSAFIYAKIPLFRYHDDIDFLISEKDIEKVKQALSDTCYKFEDNRLTNSREFDQEANHLKGEHEVIARHKDMKFHLGFILFRRETDNSMTKRKYFMHENENGDRNAYVLEYHLTNDIMNLEYSQNSINYAGTFFRTSTPESIYAKKLISKSEKGIKDSSILEKVVNKEKVEDIKKYQKKFYVVNAELPNASNKIYSCVGEER